MIRFALAGLLLFAVTAGLFWWWATPSTELVDATGARLTSGLPAAPETAVPEPAEREVEAAEPAPPPAPPALFAGAEFDEARRLMGAGSSGAAKQELTRLLQTSERDGEACILLSEVCRELGELDEAVDYGLKSVELLPDCGPAHHAYAKALADKMMKGTNKLAALVLLPRWKEAIRSAVELEPANVDARLEELTYYTYVPSLAGGDLDRALELCRELEPYEPARAKLWTALVFQRKGEPERAIELCEEGEREFPGDGMFAATLGNVLAEEERFEEADAAFEEAKRGPRGEAYYRALVSQATMHVDHGLDLEKAVALLTEYLAHHPEIPLMPPDAVALWKKGQALQGLGRTAEARAAYEECLRRQPGFTPAEDALEELGQGG